MMQSFNAELAKTIGIRPALIFGYLCECSQMEKSNGSKDTWIRCSKDLLHATFPYMENKDIGEAIDVLRDNGLIKYEPTYALTEEGKEVMKRL